MSRAATHSSPAPSLGSSSAVTLVPPAPLQAGGQVGMWAGRQAGTNASCDKLAVWQAAGPVCGFFSAGVAAWPPHPGSLGWFVDVGKGDVDGQPGQAGGGRRRQLACGVCRVQQPVVPRPAGSGRVRVVIQGLTRRRPPASMCRAPSRARACSHLLCAIATPPAVPFSCTYHLASILLLPFSRFKCTTPPEAVVPGSRRHRRLGRHACWGARPPRVGTQHGPLLDVGHSVHAQPRHLRGAHLQRSGGGGGADQGLGVEGRGGRAVHAGVETEHLAAAATFRRKQCIIHPPYKRARMAISE